MRIAVISDLHTGSATIAQDFCVGDSASAVKKGYMDDLRRLKSAESLDIDYLIVAGDITNRSEIEEFELAAERIDECASILNVNIGNVYFVPGNHDCNWSDEKKAVESKENKDKVIEKKYRHIKNNNFFSSVMKRASHGCFYNEPYFAFWEDDKVNIFGVNSSVFDSFDKHPHHGSIRRTDLQKLEHFIIEKGIENSEKLNLLIIHHHPIQHPDLPFEQADLSILQNSAQLMELMTKYNFNFVIHGHKHIPRVEQHMDGYQHPVNVLCAGSFSAYLDERFFQGVPNSLHIIEVDSHCSKNRVPQGKVKSWYHYSGHGWIIDEPVNSVPHIEYFGNYLSKAQLTDKLTTIINSEFEKKGHISWGDICSKENSFVYTPRKLLNHVINQLSNSLGFKIYFNDDLDDLFILIKNKESA